MGFTGEQVGKGPAGCWRSQGWPQLLPQQVLANGVR